MNESSVTNAELIAQISALKQKIQELEKSETQRKQAEIALKESEENFRRSLDESPLGGRIVTAEGETIYANRAMLDIYGYESIEELKTTPVKMRYTPSSYEEFLIRREKRKQGGHVPSEYAIDIISKNGEVRHLQVYRKEILWNGSKQNQVIYQDITERHNAEEELRKSEELFRSYLEYAPDAVYMSDLKGKFLYGNRRSEEISGYQREELIGKNFFKLNLLPENSLNKAAGAIQANIEGKSTGPDEIELITKEGSIIPVEINTNVVQRFGKRVSLSFVRDITERKRAEEEKRILEERLQQAEKMESIGTLAGGIAHGFNNLMTAIQGHASMVLMNLDQNDPNYERLKKIEEQIRTGADLTKQLLGFARGGKYEVKTTNMNEIIEKTSSVFGKNKKGLSLHIKAEKDLWSVEADRGQMEQIFMNLFANSWQAMPGGGNICMETQNSLLNGEQALFYLVKPGKYVKITVTDTGMGMDEKTMERIFEPFFTTKEMGRDKGTGLGLATVYGIIKGHDGIVNVESTPGQGTAFTIYLPASEKEVVMEEAPVDEIVSGTETILLVDDEAMIMEVNKELLEVLEYKVYTASSGQEGIDIYNKKRDEINLVILDMMMPGLSGGETFDCLREINPNVKVILSSGYSLTGEAQAIMERGCNGFLQKPFRLEELSGKVREILG